MSKNNGNSKISHKKLLAFSNLTNLEWQFVNLKGKKVKAKSRGKNSIHDLLTPESFAIRNEKGEIEGFSYMEGVKSKSEITSEDKEQGNEKMRRYAPIGMEYKENKAQFLKDWEVVYVGDSYKVVADFFDALLAAKYGEDNVPERGSKECPYSSREEVKEAEENIEKLNMYMTGVSIAAQFVPIVINLKFADEVFNLRSCVDDIASALDDIPTQMLKTLESKIIGANSKELLEGSIENWALFALKWGTELTNQGLKLKELNQEEILYNSAIPNNISKSDMTDDEKQKINQEVFPKIGFTQKLNMQVDDKGAGFRVVVFKKDDQIVIAYSGSEDSDKKTLPPERDLLKLVYSQVYYKYKRNNKATKIYFTGFNRGADLGMVSSLLYSQSGTAFYSKTPFLRHYIDFTPDDLNRKYWENVHCLQPVTQCPNHFNYKA